MILRRYDRSRVLKPKLRRIQEKDGQHVGDNLLVIVKVAVVDNGGVKSLSVVHHDLIDLLGDHPSRLAILWVDYIAVRTFFALSQTVRTHHTRRGP